jgi:hypothetical protein
MVEFLLRRERPGRPIRVTDAAPPVWQMCDSEERAKQAGSSDRILNE